MTETATATEIKQAHGDRDFWRSVGAPLGWCLYAWNYRSVASFYDENERLVEVTAAHVRLLDATAAERDKLKVAILARATLADHGPAAEGDKS